MAQYFRYYQTNETGKWEVTRDKVGLDAELRNKGVKRASILAVSAVVDESTDNDKLAYRGPFYIDIDNKGDLQKSIDSTKELVKKLEDMRVPDSAYEIHASGSKGFHVYIHPSAMGISRAVKRLPYIYREMAVDLYVPGLDFQVYCGGRGNLFRVPGVKRGDGRYKVPLFKAELEGMTPEKYNVLTSVARKNIVGYGMQVQPGPISSIVQLYERAKAREERGSSEKQKVSIPDQKLRPYAGDPPQCVRDLAQYEIRTGENFNRAALQMAVFLARSGASPATASSLTGLMAKHGTSSTYASERDRTHHIQGLTAYFEHQPSKAFSCAAIRSVLLKSPCDGCALFDEKQYLKEKYDVEERPGGYYAVTAKGSERRLTNFVLVPLRVVVSYEEAGKALKKTREYTQVVIERDHEFVARTQIKDEEWNSRSGFLRAFTGRGDNLRITAGDQDVQALKHYILRDIKEVEEQEVVESVGVHRQTLAGKIRFTYVEPGLSVNKFSIQQTHLYSPKVAVEDAAMPNLQAIRRAHLGDGRHTRAIRNLLKVNEPEVVAALFGWYMAAHLKAHIFGLRSEFPLLGLWGGRGSGKTQTSSLFGALHGCDFFFRPPPTFTAITEFAFLTHASACNTVPRIFDEFNKSGMGAHRYGKFSEYLKNLFNNSPSAKGSVRGTRLTVDYHKPTSPAVILSEHQFEVPALRDRLYSVMMREPALRPRTKHFEQAKEDAPFLRQVAKESMLLSLEVREEWVKEHLATWIVEVPKRFSDRQRFCRASVQVGIDFAERVLCNNMKLDVAAELADLRQAFKEHVKEEKLSVTGVGTTEVDALMVRLGELMMLSMNDQASVRISPTNLRKVDGKLLLDPLSSFPLLKLYSAGLHDRLPLNSAGELAALIRAEPYYCGEIMAPEMIRSRPVLELDLEKMQAKGIDISAFS